MDLFGNWKRNLNWRNICILYRDYTKEHKDLFSKCLYLFSNIILNAKLSRISNWNEYIAFLTFLHILVKSQQWNDQNNEWEFQSKHQRHQNDVVVLVSLLLTLNRFRILFWCFHCWHWTSKCRLGTFTLMIWMKFSIQKWNSRS